MRLSEPTIVRSSPKVETLQSLIIPSKLAVARVDPSGENAME